MERNYATVTLCIAPYSESIDKDTIRQEKSLMIAKKLTASDLNLHRTELNSEADKCPNKHRVVPYSAGLSPRVAPCQNLRGAHSTISVLIIEKS